MEEELSPHTTIDRTARARRAKAKKDEEQQARRAEARDLFEVMDLRSGRKLVYRLLEQAGVFRSTFAVDPHQTAFNEGQRNLGLWLFAQIVQETPEQYALMLKEHADD